MQISHGGSQCLPFGAIKGVYGIKPLEMLTSEIFTSLSAHLCS